MRHLRRLATPLFSFPISEGPTADGTGWTVSFATGTAPATVGVSVICAAP